MSAPPQFVLRQVQRRWGQRVALTGIDLRIDAGERLALIGPSGSGKTTLLRLLMASLEASNGSIEVAGRDIRAMPPSAIRAHRQRCGLVSQELQLIPRSTVHASVLAGCVARWPWWRVLASLLWPLERERIRSLLAEVGIAERQWDTVGQLSGGQRQRVCIARALAGDQSVLLADEPTAALDPSTGGEVIALLASETQRRAATLIISTHRVSEVRDQVDRIIGLRDGKIFFDRGAKEIDEPMLESLYAGSSERS